MLHQIKLGMELALIISSQDSFVCAISKTDANFTPELDDAQANPSMNNGSEIDVFLTMFFLDRLKMINRGFSFATLWLNGVLFVRRA